MRKLNNSKMTLINAGSGEPGCLGGILTGTVGGAAAGFQVGKYFSWLGIGWGTIIGGVVGGVVGAWKGHCFD